VKRIAFGAAVAAALAVAPGAHAAATTSRSLGLGDVKRIVVIYEENHSFDNLYGRWERANGIAKADRAHAIQVNQAGAPYKCLLQNDVNLAAPPQAVSHAPFVSDLPRALLDIAGLSEPQVSRVLADRRTTFCVVTTLEAAPLHEAEHFCAELHDRHFHLGALVLNKTLPDTLLDPAGTAVAAQFCDHAGPLAEALAALQSDELVQFSNQNGWLVF